MGGKGTPLDFERFLSVFVYELFFFKMNGLVLFLGEGLRMGEGLFWSYKGQV